MKNFGISSEGFKRLAQEEVSQNDPAGHFSDLNESVEELSIALKGLDENLPSYLKMAENGDAQAALNRLNEYKEILIQYISLVQSPLEAIKVNQSFEY